MLTFHYVAVLIKSPKHEIWNAPRRRRRRVSALLFD